MLFGGMFHIFYVPIIGPEGDGTALTSSVAIIGSVWAPQPPGNKAELREIKADRKKGSSRCKEGTKDEDSNKE